MAEYFVVLANLLLECYILLYSFHMYSSLKYFSDLLSGRLCMILHICVSLFFISLFSNVTHPSSLIISVTLAMSRLDKRRERVVVEIKK